MPAKIDTNLLPQVFRESIDPEILNRAQSIEWSIERDTGENEHGVLGDSHLLPLYDGVRPLSATPTSPNNKMMMMPMKQLGNDEIIYDSMPRAKPGEKTVHYEKSSRVLNENELNALGLDPNVFGPNSRTMVDEQEEETMESEVLRGGARELEMLYNSMRTDAGEYFDRQRARSLSPSGRRRLPIEDGHSEQKRTIVYFGSMNEIDKCEQEYYPYRDAHQGKPLPGDNEYGTWGSRADEQRQWKLCNGQWIRVAEPKKPLPPQAERYFAEKLKCKQPKTRIARSVPVRRAEPEGSTDSDTDDNDSFLDETPILRRPQHATAPKRRITSPPRRLDLQQQQPLEPLEQLDSPIEQPRVVVVAPAKPVRRLLERPRSPPVDLDALRDKYRPKVAPSKVPPVDDFAENDTKPASPIIKPADTGFILLEPIRPPTPPLEEIKAEPIQPVYVEMKKPLKQPEGEEEKLMEDPNLMWMHMGPAQFGPPLGTMKRRKGREEEWIGPPCELCHKQIEERRCMLAENMKFHCWHFACSFCLKTLKPADFLIAEANKKPYCLNCHKREFPEISLVHLNLEE